MSGKIIVNCREASRLASEALDRPLERRERIDLKVHLLLCRWCRRYKKQIISISKASKLFDGLGSDDTPGISLPEQKSTEIKAILKQDQ